MLNCGGGGGGMGEVTGDGSEVGGASHRNPCATPSSSPNGGEISGIYSGPFLPSFM